MYYCFLHGLRRRSDSLTLPYTPHTVSSLFSSFIVYHSHPFILQCSLIIYLLLPTFEFACDISSLKDGSLRCVSSSRLLAPVPLSPARWQLQIPLPWSGCLSWCTSLIPWLAVFEKQTRFQVQEYSILISEYKYISVVSVFDGVLVPAELLAG